MYLDWRTKTELVPNLTLKHQIPMYLILSSLAKILTKGIKVRKQDIYGPFRNIPCHLFLKKENNHFYAKCNSSIQWNMIFFQKKIEPSNWLANIRIATCLNINLHLQAANSECTLLPYLNFQGSKLVLYKVPMKCFLNNPANKNIA